MRQKQMFGVLASLVNKEFVNLINILCNRISPVTGPAKTAGFVLHHPANSYSNF